MPSMPKTLYFAAVSVAAIAIIHGKILRAPAFENVPKGEDCYSQSFATRYNSMPETFNRLTCMVNTVFIKIREAPYSGPLLNVFTSVFIPTCFIMLYDSLRPGSRGLARVLAMPFLLVGQVIAAGVATPLFYTLYSATTPAGAPIRPPAEYGWTALVATILGMIVPSLWVERSGWGYTPLAIWQPFPVYMVIIALVLAPVFTKLSPRSSKLPIFVSALIFIIISFKLHIDTLKGIRGGLPGLRKAFLPSYQGLDLGQAGHALFSADCLFTTLALASAVISVGSGGLGQVLFFLMFTIVAGPGAALSGLWAFNELTAAKKK